MSNFRSLAPSYQHDQSSGSSSTNQGAFAGESSNSGGTSGGASGGGDSLRRRRNAGNVSLMACKECRHARQKCDGTRPDPCSRCLQRKLVCLYEPHAKTHKDDLIREIETLRGDNESLRSDNDTLQDAKKELEEAASRLEQRHNCLQDSSDWQRLILDSISSNGHGKEIVSRLRAGESHQFIADWLSDQDPIARRIQTEPAGQPRIIDVVKRYGEGGISGANSSDGSETQWTKVCSGHSLIRHLFNLYFTWIHPLHMLFSESEFKSDYQTHSETHCSTSLVNAICAMACHLLEGEESQNKSKDVEVLRKGFLNEALACLSPDNYHHLTSIQAFAIIYLAELSAGRAQSAHPYLRSALDYLHATRLDQQSAKALELSGWGIETLNTFCTGMTYQTIHNNMPRSLTFTSVSVNNQVGVWRFYRRVGDERTLPSRECHSVITACNQAKLFMIIQESLDLYCGAESKATAQALLEVYKRFLEWKEILPQSIINVETDDQPLPHVLYLHIQYYTALVQHFCPLLHTHHFAESDLERLRALVVSHARSGMDIINHYRRLYSSRYLPPLVALCTLQISDAIIRHSQPQESKVVQDTVLFCFETLRETSKGFGICGPLQELFRRAVVDFNLRLPDSFHELMEPAQTFGVDDIVGACTRLEYTQPLSQVLSHIDPSIGNDWPYYWQRLALDVQPGRPSGRYMQIPSLLND